jgi:glycosyltransferase involved in cell wall biosynthesis
MSKPLVSILIPVYNAEKFLYGAINSSLIQTYENVEVIVYNDGSTDESEMICKSFGDKIKYIKGEKNRGIGYARWKLVEESKGDYIAFCSADDILNNMFAEMMVNGAITNPDKIIYCNNYLIDIYGNIVGSYEPFEFIGHDDFCVGCYEAATRHSMFVNFSCVLIPRKVFEKVEFNRDLRYGEDLDFLLRSMKFHRYKLVPYALTKYRVHSGMITKKKFDKIIDNNLIILKDWEKWWGDNND